MDYLDGENHHGGAPQQRMKRTRFRSSVDLAADRTRGRPLSGAYEPACEPGPDASVCAWHNGLSPPLRSGEHVKESHRFSRRPRPAAEGDVMKILYRRCAALD